MADYMNRFSTVDPIEGTFSATSFESFLNKLEKKQTSFHEKEFLRYVFTKTHQTYLKKYVAYASFNNLFTDGSYHCLTGTILYSLILNHFGIKHEVIETNYHIFLMAETDQGKILMEATDPQFGFVDSPEGIEYRINEYKQQTLEASTANLSYYRFSSNLYESVSLDEMEGLLYFNKAVDLFNQSKLDACITSLVRANESYTSSRIDEFSQILILALQQSTLEATQKKEYMKLLVSIRQRAFPLVATLN